jgi:hypothetical protein
MTREQFQEYVQRFPSGRPDMGTWSGWLVERSPEGELSAVNTYLIEALARRFVSAASVSESDLMRYLDGDIDRPIIALLDDRRKIAECLVTEAKEKIKNTIILP